MNQNKVVGHGFFRKSKAYGLVCGIALGIAFLGGHVSADEVGNVEETGVATEQVATQTVVVPVTDGLGSAIESAQSLGLTVVQEEMAIVDDSIAGEEDYAGQAEVINSAVEVRAQEIANYEAEKAAVEAENEAIVRRNAEKEAAYKQQLAEAESNKDKDGYLSRVEAQDLIFDKETNAAVTISGQYANLSVGSTNGQDKVGNIFYLNSNNFSESDFVAAPILSDTINEGADQGQSYKVLIKKDQPVTVIYDGLENSYFMGRQITKVIYTYTAREVPNRNDLVTAYIFKDPTNTIKLGSNFAGGETAYDFEAEFYFSDGSKVDFSEGSALISLSSLNASSDSTGISPSDDPAEASVYREYVSQISGGEFIKITGSSVDMHNGSVYSDTNNAILGDQWDKEDSDFAYYGAGALKLTGDKVTFTFGGTNDSNQLFSFNSRVKATGIPVTPTYEEEKPLPTAPVGVTVFYYLNAFKNELVSVKDVVKNGVSIDNGTLRVGETATYTLQAPLILANGQDELVKYEIVDVLDVEHDKYLGYRVYAFVPIKLTDGTVLQSQADLVAFVQQTYDESTGRFVVNLNSDFLARVAKDSDFQVGVDVDFVRIKAGEVFNDFTTNIAFKDVDGNIIEYPVKSNEVKTITPEEPEEVVVDGYVPAEVVPEAPVVQAAALPKTGDEATILSVVVGLFMVLFGLLGIRKFEKK
ncbi:GbpC/Spa domain-containing protein [Streptococcus sp. H31]|uniref:GbpC/Spa domain-containing protein n=1 Tax=Streptococcus huangxiaojuni TaxID=3237239 RepID=UPI0034A232D3